MRKHPEPEDVFLAHIKRLIKNLFIDNPNYTNNYYWNDRGFDHAKFMADTKKRATYVLEQIDETDHLVKPFPERDLDGPCFYCGRMTSSFAGNPGEWPLVFPQRDGTGKVKFHHTSCVLERLHKSEEQNEETESVGQQEDQGSSGPGDASQGGVLAPR